MQSNTPPLDRPERIISHALVEIKKFNWFPFGTKSAVLLDISLTGFKIEFTGKTTCKSGDIFWLQIPLSPFGMKSPNHIAMRIIIKWFDPEKMRIGGVFDKIDTPSKVFLEKIIEKVKAQNIGH